MTALNQPLPHSYSEEDALTRIYLELVGQQPANGPDLPVRFSRVEALNRILAVLSGKGYAPTYDAPDGIPTVEVGGSDPNHAHFTNLAALLEPDALEPMQVGTFSYAIASDATKYLMASWATRLASSGRMEVRDPREPLPLRGQTVNGTDANSYAMFMDPTLPVFTNAWQTYYDRLAAVAVAPTRTIALTGASNKPLFLPGPYGTLITSVTVFDFAWIIVVPSRLYSAGAGINLANEESDTAAHREFNRLYFPVDKRHANALLSADQNGLGAITFIHLPATWSKVTNGFSMSSGRTFIFRDDFMGTALNATTVWDRAQSAAGNIEIDTLHQWCKWIGSNSWGANSAFSNAIVGRDDGKVFLCDVVLGGAGGTDGGCVGFSNGQGYANTDFAHAVNFNSGAINVLEDGTDRGTVGSGYTAGVIYRIRITIDGPGAAYAIQGGSQYGIIGSDTWTDITPNESLSAFDMLHAAFAAYGNTNYISDVRIY